MSTLHAIILGLIQGVGEFLPISSSGHLVLMPYLFGWEYQGLAFDVALHFGTVLAIIAFFWQDWILIISNSLSPAPHQQSSNRAIEQYPRNLLWIILVASIPAAIAGYFLENLAQHTLRNPLLVAILLAVFGLILWLADVLTSGDEKLKKIGYIKGFVVGTAQAIALFPGVSRSGVTATAGMFLGLSRKSAMRFSFLLATPAMVGAFALTLKDFQTSLINFAFVLAILVSAVSGFLSIKFLLKFLEKHGFSGFAIYRLALAAVIIILYLVR